jgi:hypothetical protein
MRLVIVLLPLCIGCVAPAGEPPAGGDVPNTTELVQRVPVLRPDDPSVKSFTADGTMEIVGGQVRFSVSFVAPDRYALSLWSLDGTPLFIATGDRVLSYDTPRARLFYWAGCKYRFELFRDDAEHLRIDFNVAVPRDDEPKKPRLVLELRGLLTDAGARAEKTGPQGYRLTGAFGKNVVRATLDLARHTPLDRFELRDAGDGKARFVLSRVAVNEPVRDNRFAFPDIDRLRRELAVDVFAPQSRRDALDQMRAAMGWVARFGISDVARRPDFEQMQGKVDWEQARVDDARLAPKLRALMPPVETPTTRRSAGTAGR